MKESAANGTQSRWRPLAAIAEAGTAGETLIACASPVAAFARLAPDNIIPRRLPIDLTRYPGPTERRGRARLPLAPGVNDTRMH
jgi:hypothetical protein